MLHRLIHVFGAIASIVVAYLTAALIGGLAGGPVVAIAPGAPTQSIGLAIGSIHTDVLLPLTPELRTAFAFAEPHGLPITHPDAEWLIVGWGARGVYTTMGTWGDVRMPTLLRAITGDSAVFRLDVTGAFDTTDVRMITVTDGQLASLTRIIRSAMTDAPLPDAGFTATDRYYPATGRFHIARTCNVWLGETLRAAGIAFGRWTPTPYAVRISLWRFHSNTR